MEQTEQNNLQKHHKEAFSVIGLACFVILFVSTALQLAAVILTQRFTPQWTGQPWFVWALTFIPLYAVGVPIGMTVFKCVPARSAVIRKLRFRDLLVFLVMCFPIMYIGNILGTLSANALHMLLGTEMKNPLDTFLNSSSIWLYSFVFVIMAPVIEEFVFRKLIIDRLRTYGEGTCVLVSALLFGLFHGNLNQFFYAFGLGALFAFIYVKTGRLRYTVFLHMVINFFGGFLTPLLMKNIDLNTLTGINPGDVMGYLAEHFPQLIALGLYSMLNFALTITGFVLLIVRRRAFFPEQGTVLERGPGFKTMFLNPGMALFAAAALTLFVLAAFL